MFSNDIFILKAYSYLKWLTPCFFFQTCNFYPLQGPLFSSDPISPTSTTTPGKYRFGESQIVKSIIWMMVIKFSKFWYTNMRLEEVTRHQLFTLTPLPACGAMSQGASKFLPKSSVTSLMSLYTCRQKGIYAELHDYDEPSYSSSREY